jgi:hypothetical protein
VDVCSSKATRRLILHKQCDAANVYSSANATLQDMVDSVGDVRVMHDDISVGMGGLKSFVADGFVQVREVVLVWQAAPRCRRLAAVGLACECDCAAAGARCLESSCP